MMIITLKKTLTLLLIMMSINGYNNIIKFNSKYLKNFKQEMSKNDEDLARANRITFLLNNAVKMIKMKTLNNTVKVLKPLELSFLSSHKVKIYMNDSIAAHNYLCLPTSNYSLLNSDLISRSEDDEDIFEMSLPLGDLTSVTGIKISAILKTSIKVIPDTSNGKLIFQSGPFYFLPKVKNDTRNIDSSIENISNNTYNENIEKGLPEWLIWGGQSEDDEAKSSIQAGFKTELTWDPPQDIDSLINMNDRDQDGKDQLLVKAKVDVFVDLNVPLREDLSRAISFLPVKLLLQQAGSLATNAALRSLAPTFAELLKKDHDRRRTIQVASNTITNSEFLLMNSSLDSNDQFI